MEKKYSYNDWLNGIVYLGYAQIQYAKGGKKSPIIVEWKSFGEPDIEKIKAKQKEVFNQEVERLLNKRQLDFKQKYTNSQTKALLLKNELHDLKHLLISTDTYEEEVLFKNINVSFSPDQLFMVKSYINRYITHGKKNEYEYIHSPFSKHKGNNVHIQTYSQFWWDYYTWLKATFLKNHLKSSFEIKNEHGSTFVNQNAFLVFDSLIKSLGETHSNFSFLFRKMYEDGLIHKDSASAFSEWAEKIYKPIKFKSNLQTLSHSVNNTKLRIYKKEVQKKFPNIKIK